MSNETRHALALACISPDTLDALNEIAMLVETSDDLDLDINERDELDLDLDVLDARAVDVIAMSEISLFDCLASDLDELF